MKKIEPAPVENTEGLTREIRDFWSANVNAERLFGKHVSIKKDYLYGEGYGKLFRMTPTWIYRPMSALVGWHLMTRASK